MMIATMRSWHGTEEQHGVSVFSDVPGVSDSRPRQPHPQIHKISSTTALITMASNGIGIAPGDLDTNLVPVFAEQDVMQQLVPASLGEAVHILGG
jgi:hypothetical protein